MLCKTLCRGRLAKLLRFHTSKSPKDLTCLAGYVSRKPFDA
jgi:hypothetical protein